MFDYQRVYKYCNTKPGTLGLRTPPSVDLPCWASNRPQEWICRPVTWTKFDPNPKHSYGDYIVRNYFSTQQKIHLNNKPGNCKNVSLWGNKKRSLLVVLQFAHMFIADLLLVQCFSASWPKGSILTNRTGWFPPWKHGKQGLIQGTQNKNLRLLKSEATQPTPFQQKKATNSERFWRWSSCCVDHLVFEDLGKDHPAEIFFLWYWICSLVFSVIFEKEFGSSFSLDF